MKRTPQQARRFVAIGLGIALFAGGLGFLVLGTSGAQATDGALPECSTELHDSYTAQAQDGMTFPTWHPVIVTDPATNAECTFGHEHGDDPSTSDIYDWALARLGSEASGITFGFAAHMSMMSGGAHRHEDHYGHKVFVLNDVDLVREDREGYVLDGAAAPVQCDYLIYTHQGSHSGDALKNNQHELLYAAQCSDGTEMVVNTLTGYGSANEYTANCDARRVATGGSDLPNGAGGGREIPDVDCMNRTANEFWSAYELWKADQTILGVNGEALVSYDPWFGVRNPSRVGNGADPVDTVTLVGPSRTMWPWTTQFAGVAKNDPASPFDGAQRDVYVQNSVLDNAGGGTTIYTDAYGQQTSTEPFDGAIAQYVSAVSNVAQPTTSRSAYGFSTDYGSGNGVHASN